MHQCGYTRISFHERAHHRAEAFPGRHLSRLPDRGVSRSDPGREDEEGKTPRTLLRTDVEKAVREAGRQSRNLVASWTRDFLGLHRREPIQSFDERISGDGQEVR